MCFPNVPLRGLIFWKCVEVERWMWMALSLLLIAPYAGFKQAISAVLFQLKWKAIYIQRWWWWFLEPLWFPGDHTSPSFDRLWGAWRLCFADTLTILVNCLEWLSFKWSTSVTSEVITPPPPEITGHYYVSSFSCLQLALFYHLPRKTLDIYIQIYMRHFFSQILFTNLSKCLLVSTSPSPIDLSAWF